MEKINMSKEDFVTYEQALALKKLGFNEECLFHYEENNEIYPNGTTRNFGNTFEITCKHLYRIFNKDKSRPYYIDAPTLAQVQKWFRSIGYSIEPLSVDKHEWLCPIAVYKGDKRDTIKMPNSYVSYEEALSAGITECIKLLDE